MCIRAKCRQCSKVTYSGCGKHLDKVFRGIDASELCRCRDVAPAAFAEPETEKSANAA